MAREDYVMDSRRRKNILIISRVVKLMISSLIRFSEDGPGDTVSGFVCKVDWIRKNYQDGWCQTQRPWNYQTRR